MTKIHTWLTNPGWCQMQSVKVKMVKQHYTLVLDQICGCVKKFLIQLFALSDLKSKVQDCVTQTHCKPSWNLWGTNLYCYFTVCMTLLKFMKKSCYHSAPPCHITSTVRILLNFPNLNRLIALCISDDTINRGLMEMKKKKSMLLLIFILDWDLLAYGTVCHLSVFCDWSVQLSAEFQPHSQCLLADAERTESAPRRVPDSGKTYRLPCFSCSLCATGLLQGLLIPTSSRLAPIAAGCLPQLTPSTRRVHWHSLAFSFQHSFPAPFPFSSSVQFQSLAQLTASSDLEQCL